MNDLVEPAVTPQQEHFSKSAPFTAYKSLSVGDSSWVFFFVFEFSQILFAGLPGIFGLGSRSLLFPHFFASCGKRLALGRDVILRNPRAIRLGSKVFIDDGACLDSRTDSEIVAGDLVSIGRYTSVVAKGGKVSLGPGVNIGSYCRLATQSQISIGESTLVGAFSYIGPGNHQQGDGEKPMISREMEIKGGVTIGKEVWIGARCTILDGVTIGDGAVVGAHSLVLKDVAPGATVVGTPAREIHSK